MVITGGVIHSLRIFLFLNFETVGQKTLLMSVSRKKLNLKLKNNMQLKEKELMKKNI